VCPKDRRAVVGRIGVVWHELRGTCVEGHDAVAEESIGTQAACDAHYDAEDAFAGGYAPDFGWGTDCVHCGGCSAIRGSPEEGCWVVERPVED
jgi:hypothetical protein